MDGIYDYIMLISFLLSGILLVVTIGLFFGLHITQVWKELNGSMAVNMKSSTTQRQMAEIRLQNSEFGKRKKVNVFADVENWTDEVGTDYDAGKMATTSFGMNKQAKAGTTMLRKGYAATTMLSRGNAADNDFVIDKDIVYVSTERCL